MTIADKLQSILDSKAAIKAAIESKGVVDVGDVLSDYPSKINNIPTNDQESTYYSISPDTFSDIINEQQLWINQDVEVSLAPFSNANPEFKDEIINTIQLTFSGYTIDVDKRLILNGLLYLFFLSLLLTSGAVEDLIPYIKLPKYIALSIDNVEGFTEITKEEFYNNSSRPVYVGFNNNFSL